MVTLNGKDYQCPTCWEQVTVAQHKQILDWDTDKELHERDFFKLFCILTGTNFKSFNNTPENEVTIWNAIKWVVEQPFQFDKEPKALQIGDKIMMIPRDLGMAAIGQNVIMRQVLEKAKVYSDADGNVIDYNCYAEAVAVYVQPMYDEGKFDYKKALELVPVIEQMPVYLIKPIGFFLLSRAIESGQRQTKNWLRTLISRISARSRARQGLPALTFSASGITSILLASTLRFTGAIQTMYFGIQVLIR